MSGPYDRPRVTINWAQVRPKTLRGWTTLVGGVAVGFAVLALVAVIASTLFAVALIVALVAAVAFFIGNIFRGRKSRRSVEPYRGDF
jgi:hypothetical protein